MKATLTSTLYSQQHQVDSSPTKHIEESTLSYLHTSFLLWEYKTSYDAREYRQLLDDYGWDKGSSEEQRALKIAKHFQHLLITWNYLPITGIFGSFHSTEASVTLPLIEPYFNPFLQE